MVERILRVLSPLLLGLVAYTLTLQVQANQDELNPMVQSMLPAGEIFNQIREVEDINVINSGNFHISELGQFEARIGAQDQAQTLSQSLK